MRLAPASNAELRSNLTRVMDDIRAGKLPFCPPSQGFDNQTTDAINEYATASPRTPQLEDAVNRALAGQISGLNASEDAAALAKALDAPEG